MLVTGLSWVWDGWTVHCCKCWDFRDGECQCCSVSQDVMVWGRTTAPPTESSSSQGRTARLWLWWRELCCCSLQITVGPVVLRLPCLRSLLLWVRILQTSGRVGARSVQGLQRGQQWDSSAPWGCGCRGDCTSLPWSSCREGRSSSSDHQGHWSWS